MRSARRSNAQLKITSRSRDNVFNFMRQFHAVQMWTINGPMDTEIDEIICFTWYSRAANAHGMFEHRGVVMIQTNLEGHGFALYPQGGADITELMAAYNAPEGEVRIPVEGMTPTGFADPSPAGVDLKVLPSDDTDYKALFFKARDLLNDNAAAWDDEEESVKEEHAELIEATSTWLDNVANKLMTDEEKSEQYWESNTGHDREGKPLGGIDEG